MKSCNVSYSAHNCSTTAGVNLGRPPGQGKDVHTYIHTDRCIYVHRCRRTDKCMYVQRYIHTYIHTDRQMYIHIYIHTYIHTYVIIMLRESFTGLGLTYLPTYLQKLVGGGVPSLPPRSLSGNNAQSSTYHTYIHTHTHPYVNLHTSAIISVHTYIHT